MQRPRHPKKELEEVLSAAEDRKWRVTRGKNYFKMWCPCPDRHMKTVKLSPSDPSYKKNLLAKLERATCWEGTP
ncbi:MAG TPA: hypothetical protein VM142_12465 [Acidimicrobiales bacterium]|nr:hypothetical protein [Acidimicrobiales bacterium]